MCKFLFWEDLTSKMIIFPLSRNASIFFRNYFFYSPVSLLFKFHALPAPPRISLSHCPGPPCNAECNILLWAVYIHTLFIYSVLCVSKNVAPRSVLYNIYVTQTHDGALATWQRWYLCQWEVDFVATSAERKLVPKWQFLVFLAVISIQLWTTLASSFLEEGKVSTSLWSAPDMSATGGGNGVQRWSSTCSH